MTNPFEFLTTAQLAERALQHEEARRRRTQWGSWTYQRQDRTLSHTNGYTIVLERITRSCQMLDWIFHIKRKQRADHTCMADLLDALEDLLQPCANYCSMEQDKTANPAVLLHARE
jgi:hypothetical protein